MVQIRDMETGAVVQSMRHHASVLGLAWHPDGALLAAASADANIHIWNVATGKEQAVLSGHQGAAVQVRFNHRGNLLASVGWDDTLRLWDALTWRLVVSKPVRAGGFEFSSDDRWLAYLADQPRLGICEVVSAPECRLLCSRTDAIRNPAMCSYSSDGQWLVSSHGDGVRLWQTASGKELAFIPERDAGCAYLHPGGANLLTSGGGGLKLWAIDPQQKNGSIHIGAPQILGNPSPIARFSVTRDGHLVAFAQDGIFHLLDLESRRDIADFDGDVPSYFTAVSADGKLAAGAGSRGAIVRVWDTQSGKILKDLPVKNVTHLAFRPDGQWLVTCTVNEHRFWDTHSWQCLHSLPREKAGYLSGHSAFTQDNRLAAIGYSAQSLRLIDPSSGSELATLEMPDSQVISWFCFSPDGTQLAVSGRTPVIYLWDLPLIRQQLGAMKLDWGSPRKDNR